MLKFFMKVRISYTIILTLLLPPLLPLTDFNTAKPKKLGLIVLDLCQGDARV